MDSNIGLRCIPKLSKEEISKHLGNEISEEELDDIINGLQTLSIVVFEVLNSTKK